jgi:hypothetical protein
MSKLAFHYNIRSNLPPRLESPGVLGKKVIATLDALTAVDSNTFTNWQVMNYPARAALPLARARTCISEIIANNAARDDWSRPRPEWNYTAGAFTGDVNASRFISVHITTGGNERGETNLETGSYKVFPDSAIIEFSVFKEALRVINAIWPPSWACAYAFRSESINVPVAYGPGVQGYRLETLPMIPSDPTFPKSIFHIPWFVYLSAQLATGLVLPPPEIVTERTSDGGLLMVATKDRLDPENPEHVRRARILAETMIARTGYQPERKPRV